MIRKGFTQKGLAEHMGVTPQTLSNKMKSGNFSIKDAEKIILALSIENPAAIFFANLDT